MKYFITGGAGFIGCNSADHYLKRGHDVVVYDNLSRPGSQRNLEWLHGQHGDDLRFAKGDVRDFDHLSREIDGSDVVLHLASQVAVTTSIEDPREDFEVNALGTFNVLEAVRNHCPQAVVLYASTNKVYGALENVKINELASRHEFAEFVDGIPENFPLDFHSPYGCSKGAGDQYVIDYARIYGLKTVSLRQSCIYGERQFGVEDQGWIAHLIIAAYLNRPLNIYGDGKQVRDVLHIADLLRAYDSAIEHADEVSGGAINIGGGPSNTLSIWAEFQVILESLLGHPVEASFDSWRAGDQLVYVSDIQRAKLLLDWQPEVPFETGIKSLYDWIAANSTLF
ncbi:MAG TPA: NAD-dependent epimerase/dehydratase family protein [candidate division Zixibacteria bacterium]|nr:NAD-dependent epimerase/dehydratase family protein [candidate division Zixibacteria bacterium]